jgi:ketosteroid isomerase-like protein
MPAISSIIIPSLLILLVVCSQAKSNVQAAESTGDAQYAIRGAIRDYRMAMNHKSIEDVIALYTSDGTFVDQSLNMEFTGTDELRNLYGGIFGRNPRLTFTIFPWNIDVSTDSAFVTCSWSLVSSYGVYNGIYWISMSKVSDQWKIVKITTFITVLHPYNQPYGSLP